MEKVRKPTRKLWIRFVVVISVMVIISISVVSYWHYVLAKDLDPKNETVIDTGEGKELDEIVKGDRAYADWNESKTLDVMHKMTHQKVLASEKWGAVEMRADRINELYTLVKN